MDIVGFVYSCLSFRPFFFQFLLNLGKFLTSGTD